jgi:antitoxin component HigA of HigAB toxin-antitoxin module
MKTSVINTKAQYDAALVEIDKLLNCKPHSIDAKKLASISILVESYENIYFPIS